PPSSASLSSASVASLVSVAASSDAPVVSAAEGASSSPPPLKTLATTINAMTAPIPVRTLCRANHDFFGSSGGGGGRCPCWGAWPYWSGWPYGFGCCGSFGLVYPVGCAIAFSLTGLCGFRLNASQSRRAPLPRASTDRADSPDRKIEAGVGGARYSFGMATVSTVFPRLRSGLWIALTLFLSMANFVFSPAGQGEFSAYLAASTLGAFKVHFVLMCRRSITWDVMTNCLVT